MINNNDMKGCINIIRHSSLFITQIRLEADVKDTVKDADKKTVKYKIKKVKEFKQKERKFSRQFTVERRHKK